MLVFSVQHNKSAVYFLITVIVIFLFSCGDVQTKKNEPIIKQTTIINDTIVILTFGAPLPPFYTNAQDIIAEKYNLQYKVVAGCIVSQFLIDSVKIENQKAIKKLTNRNPPQYIDSIYLKIQKESVILSKINSMLINKKVWKHNGYTYFTKNNKEYKAYHVIYNGKAFNVNQSLIIDSLTFKINNNSVPIKDSVITNLSNLNYENN